MDLPFDVVDLGPAADAPDEGDTAPDFTRPLVNEAYWADRSLDAVVAEDPDAPTVLLFHPMAGSFPATYVWKEVTKRDWAADATVVGLSIATPYAHKRLIDDHEMGADYRVYSDPGNGVAEDYGIAHALDGMNGVSEPRPAAFVLDSDREVQFAWVAESWPDFPPYDAIEDAIR